MKRHSPKIRDESKLPRTAIPKTPRRKVPKSNKHKYVKKNSSKVDASGLTDRRATHRGLECAVKPCKKSIHVNLENKIINQNDVVEKNSDCEMKSEPQVALTLQPHYLVGYLQVYQNIFKENECLKNSRKLGPNCPSTYKKTRMQRRKTTTFGSFWNATTVDQCQSYRKGATLNYGSSRQKLWVTWGCKRKRSKRLNRRQKLANSIVHFDMALQSVGTHQVRKRITHFANAKVDFDKRTLIAWKQPMENDGSRSTEEMNRDTEKFWEEERKVYHERVLSFISVMHLIQGDRRFSEWKGSVLDSVGGVFLTQNVTDHFSSSTFMSVAARFPTVDIVDEFIVEYSHICSMGKAESGSIEAEVIVKDAVQSFQDASSDPTLINISNFCSTDKFPTYRECLSQMSSVVAEMPLSSKLHEVKVKEEAEMSKMSSVFAEMPLSSKLHEVEVKEEVEMSQMSPVFAEMSLSSKLHEVEVKEETEMSQMSLVFAEMPLSSKLHAVEVEVKEDAEMSQMSSIFAEIPLSSKLHEVEVKEGAEMSQMLQKFAKMSLSSKLHEVEVKEKEVNSMGKLTDNKGKKKANDHQDENRKLGSVEDEVIAKDSHIYSMGKAELGYTGAVVIVEDAVQTFPQASSDPTLTDILVSCSSGKSTYRKCLQLKEANFLEQFNGHQEAEMLKMSPVFAEMPLSSKLYEVKVKEVNPVRKPNDNKGKKKANNRQDGIRESSQLETTQGGKKGKVKSETPIDWDELRRTYSDCRMRNTARQVDSVNWEAVRKAPVKELAKVIAARGMENLLAGRIKDFLDRMVKDHGSIDLEWLRNVPPDKAKDYLLSIPGLGLKSVECLRLLTLHHVAFPVDTNVGRIVVRLGWVPLQPLPEDVQIHLLNQYPMVDAIQKHLWPRFCTLDHQTLYELHYQLITFGKVFCTKKNPNCNACPMKGQCKHFASAFASAKLRLPGSQAKFKSASEGPIPTVQDPAMQRSPKSLPFSDDDFSDVMCESCNCEPIVEVPPSPEPMKSETLIRDIEDFYSESEEEEIPTIKLNAKAFKENLMDFVSKTSFLSPGSDMSKALVAVSPEVGSIPMPKLMALHRLRTVHQVYEVPDDHPLLAGFKKRECYDPSPYLIRIWTTDELANSSPRSGKMGTGNTQDASTCSGDIIEEQDDQTVKGTILIPCRTANSGSFPLNGTYFQVNEVFADHQSSRRPISVPRKCIWTLRRRSLYCGKSTPSIFKSMSMEEIQFCFGRGFICIRGVDRVTGNSRPLSPKFHPYNTMSKLEEDED